MFKFYTKGEDDFLEGVVFLNGQKVVTVQATRYADGEIFVDVFDGSDNEQVSWSDFEESD